MTERQEVLLATIKQFRTTLDTLEIEVLTSEIEYKIPSDLDVQFRVAGDVVELAAMVDENHHMLFAKHRGPLFDTTRQH